MPDPNSLVPRQLRVPSSTSNGTTASGPSLVSRTTSAPTAGLRLPSTYHNPEPLEPDVSPATADSSLQASATSSAVQSPTPSLANSRSQAPSPSSAHPSPTVDASGGVPMHNLPSHEFDTSETMCEGPVSEDTSVDRNRRISNGVPIMEKPSSLVNIVYNSKTDELKDRQERAIAALLTRFKNLVVLAALPTEDAFTKETAAAEGLRMEVESNALV